MILYISKLISIKDKIPRPARPDYKPKLATTVVISPPQGLTIFSYCWIPTSTFFCCMTFENYFFFYGFIAFITYKLMLPFHVFIHYIRIRAAYHTILAFKFVLPAYVWMYKFNVSYGDRVASRRVCAEQSKAGLFDERKGFV